MEFDTAADAEYFEPAEEGSPKDFYLVTYRLPNGKPFHHLMTQFSMMNLIGRIVVLGATKMDMPKRSLASIDGDC